VKKISVLSLCLLTACVTINIYFPAKAAEKVADEIIKGIQQDSKLLPDPALQQLQPGASNSQWQLAILRLLDGSLNFLISPAQAEANLAIDTAEIRQLRAAMKKRYAGLQSYYANDFVGIQSDGLLIVRNAGKIPLKDRNKVNKLVAAENSDRNKLYQAIASANGHPDWAAQIQATFAKRWISNAQAGWSYQNADGNWLRK
jgi:uncharacterized protein YdbL (DUF1318 family)